MNDEPFHISTRYDDEFDVQREAAEYEYDFVGG